MKIVKLSVENLMRISAVEINPEGNVVILSGANGEGKTSILNGIAFALGGKALIPDKPIKEGKTSATVKVDLGEFIVIRKWTANDKSTLKIESKDGMIFKSPQAMLDKIIGELTFNPVGFMQMSPKEQRNILLGLVDLGIDLDAVAEEGQSLYDQRTAINRELKAKEGEAAGLPPLSPDPPRQEISISNLTTALQNGVEHNSLNHSKKTALAKTREEIESLEEQMAILLARLNELLAEDISADVDIEGIQAKIETAEAANQEIREEATLLAKHAEIDAAIKELSKTSDSLTQGINNLGVQKKDALSKAVFPIDGLSVDAEGVLLHGIPLEQECDSEKLKVSLAIAMALNPELKVIQITNGSLLDNKNMDIIEMMAGDKDFQIWIERVDESGKVGIVIEDGAIKHQ